MDLILPADDKVNLDPPDGGNAAQVDVGSYFVSKKMTYLN